MTGEDPNLQNPLAESESERPRSRWERLVWPRWLPTRARLPLIAQITGAFALMAAVTMPQWTVGDPPAMAATAPALETPTAVAAPAAAVAPVPAAGKPRPAHLNLDLRHNFRSVDLTVTVDSRRVLDTKLEGAGKKFGVFGRRAERSYTRTLDLQPGARVVRLHLKSADEKFEHTRVERFDLGPASVATMRIDIEKSGLSVIADRPALPAPAPSGAPQAESAPAPVTTTAPPTLPPADASQAAQAVAQAHKEAQEASALAALYQTLRSTLIALAGFIASVASGFLFEEYLKSRNLSPFTGESPRSTRGNGNPQAVRVLRRRRERRVNRESDISIDAGLS